LILDEGRIMASISVSADSFIRKVSGGAGAGDGTDARYGRKPADGVAGKRQPVDEYIASLPARAAFIGGRTLETLTSLPPLPQQKKERDGNAVNNAGGVGIGINTIGRTGIDAIGLGGIGTVNTGAGAIGATDADEKVEKADEVDEADDNEKDETDEADKADKADKNKVDAELSPEEQGVVNELRNRDREVRAHEQAHVSAGGAYIRGAVSYTYRRGPDNKSYAVGGEVGIDTSPEDDAGATITKMQAVRAAALAPSDPSAQDRAVAAAAAGNESLARADLAAEKRNEDEG